MSIGFVRYRYYFMLLCRSIPPYKARAWKRKIEGLKGSDTCELSQRVYVYKKNITPNRSNGTCLKTWPGVFCLFLSHTVDGSEIRRSPPGMCNQTRRTCDIYHINWWAGFFPSTVFGGLVTHGDMFKAEPPNENHMRTPCFMMLYIYRIIIDIF